MGGHHGRSHCCRKRASDVPQRYCQKFCGQMKLKLCCLEGTHNNMCGEKKGTPHQHQTLIPTVKYGGGSIMVWGCFAASEPGQLAIRRKNEFPSLSRHFGRECKAICPLIEAQQKLGDATGQQPIRQK